MSDQKSVDQVGVAVTNYLANEVINLQEKITALEQALAVAEEALSSMCEDFYKMPEKIRMKYYKPSSHIANKALEKIKAIKEEK